MKEPYMKGVANHYGPESCAGSREIAREAVDRGKCGPAIELRNHHFGAPTLYNEGEGNIGNSVNERAVQEPSGVKDPVHAWKLYVREPGDLKSLRLVARQPERLEKACGHTPSAYALEKSDIVVVPKKKPNNAGSKTPAAEALEERTMTNGNF